MKFTVYNIEVNSIILDINQKRLGLVTEIYSPAPYISVGVLFMGTTQIEVIDQYRLTNHFEFRVVPTYDIFA